jgi:hypothetical protein
MATMMCPKPVVQETIASTVVTAEPAEVGTNVVSMTETVQEEVVALDVVEDRMGVQGDGMIMAKDSFGVAVEAIFTVAVVMVFVEVVAEMVFVEVDEMAITEVVEKVSEEADVMDFEVVDGVVARKVLVISWFTIQSENYMLQNIFKNTIGFIYAQQNIENTIVSSTCYKKLNSQT